jgi:GGDEF domain-containing protein
LSFPQKQPSPKVTVSMGAAICHSGFLDYDPQNLIEAADRCLYRAKAEGLGLGFYVESLQPEGLDQAMLSADLSPRFAETYEAIPEEDLVLG